MSNNSTQASSVESPPSTCATSVSTSMDASGCVHLAEFVSKGQRAKHDFVRGLDQARSRAQKDYHAQAPALQYHCVQCAEFGDAVTAETHGAHTQHLFSFCPQTSAVYCAQCKDIIYDKISRQKPGDGASSPSHLGKKRSSSEVAEDDSYIDGNSTKRPCGRENVRGLFNLGHTCYMNAVIQTMIHNSLLSSFFLGKGHPPYTCCKGDDPDEDETPCVACGFADIFSESRFSENTQPMAALSLLKASWLAIPAMQGERQQDAHEWYLQIIDKLHDCETPSFDSKGVCRCFIHKAFFGRIRQEICCNKCGFVSQTQDHMLYLGLDFQKQLAASTPKKKGGGAAAAAPPPPPPSADPSTTETTTIHSPSLPANPTMISCLEDFIAVESLSDDSYSCRGCSRPGKMTKSVRIRKLPAILCMQVNRFQKEGKAGHVVKKIKGRMQYPLEIDLRPFTTKADKTRTRKDEAGNTTTTPKHRPSSAPSDQFIYELESVIVHEGKAIEQGHYFAFCRAPNTDTTNNKWYMFNDAKVTVAAEPMVLEQEAYLLFYTLKRVRGGPSPRPEGQPHKAEPPSAKPKLENLDRSRDGVD